MNICLISWSNQVRDFIYLIKKILKKGKGINQVSERLYKPMPTKSEYQKKQLKRPSNVFPKKQSGQHQQEKIKPEAKVQQEKQELNILQSVVTVESVEVDNNVPIEQKSIKEIPKTFLQTMAYNLKEQGLINKMKNTLGDQIKYFRDLETFHNTMVNKMKIIELSKQELLAIDRTTKLKAWSYHKALKQFESLDKEINQFLIPLGFQAEDKEYQNKMANLLINHANSLQSSLNFLEQYKTVNFFDNNNIQQIVDFLIIYEEAFDKCENSKLLLLKEGSLCDSLYMLKINTDKMISEIKEQFGNFANQFQQENEQSKLLQELLNIQLLPLTVYYIVEKADYQASHHKQIIQCMERMVTIKQRFDQFLTKRESIKKLIKLRDKQLKTLEIVINFINSSHSYNRAFLIESFFLKEIYFLELELTNYDYLKYLSDNFKHLQDQLLQKGLFVSSINLKLLDFKLVNTVKKIAENIMTKKEIKPSIQKQTKTSLIKKEKDYLKRLSELNKQTSSYIQQRLSSKDSRLKVEQENKIERIKARLLQESIVKKHEEKHYDFLVLKYRKQKEEENIVKEIKVQEKKHKDLLGQLLYLVQDARFKYYSSHQTSIYNQIINFYNAEMYKQGFPKILSKSYCSKQIDKIQNLYENILALTADFAGQINNYLLDNSYKQYFALNKKTEIINEALQVDFINYSLTISLKLLNLIEYHQRTYTVQNFLEFQAPKTPEFNIFSLQDFLKNIQKFSENLYDILQKNSDKELRIQWSSSLKNQIICNQNKQDKLFQVIRQINHCFILQYEVIRLVIHELTIEIFLRPVFSFNIRQIAEMYIEKQIQQQLQKKTRYFPNFKTMIMQQLEPFFKYIEDTLFPKIEVYYLLSLLSSTSPDIKRIEQYTAAYPNIISNFEDTQNFRMKGIQYLSDLHKYKDLQFIEMIEQWFSQLDQQRVSTRQQVQKIIDCNLSKLQAPLNTVTYQIIIEIPFFADQILTIVLIDPNMKQKIVNGSTKSNFITVEEKSGFSIITMTNLFINPRIIGLFSSIVPKSYKVTINGDIRIIQPGQHVLRFCSYLLLKYNTQSKMDITNQYQYDAF